MQVDFHHGVTYVVARLAGFSASEADIIASSAQFVDDAVDSGKLYFKNGAVFEFTASAHKMLDYRNFEKLANHHVWIPFHFLLIVFLSLFKKPSAAPTAQQRKKWLGLRF